MIRGIRAGAQMITIGWSGWASLFSFAVLVDVSEPQIAIIVLGVVVHVGPRIDE